MPNCTMCNIDVSRIYGGLCVNCLSIKAAQTAKEKLDTEHSTDGLQINTPIGNDLMRILRTGQGNFSLADEAKGQESIKVAENESSKAQKTTKLSGATDPQQPKDELKTIKTSEILHIVCRPAGEARFAGTIDASKIDGSIYGVAGDNVWYFNRLFVPKQLRSTGIANKLLMELVKVMEEDKITMVCDVNSYGDLDEEQLINLYRKYGFNDTGDGYLLYTPKKV